MFPSLSIWVNLLAIILVPFLALRAVQGAYSKVKQERIEDEEGGKKYTLLQRILRFSMKTYKIILGLLFFMFFLFYLRDSHLTVATTIEVLVILVVVLCILCVVDLLGYFHKEIKRVRIF